MPRRVANSVNSPTIRSNTSCAWSTRSILFTATRSRGIPSSEAMNECRLVCVRMPWAASMRMIARCAVEAPVAMLRVYCSWPGVSAMMKFRRGVEK